MFERGQRKQTKKKTGVFVTSSLELCKFDKGCQGTSRGGTLPTCCEFLRQAGPTAAALAEKKLREEEVHVGCSARRWEEKSRRKGAEKDMRATAKIRQPCSLFMSYYSYSGARPQTQSPGTQ